MENNQEFKIEEQRTDSKHNKNTAEGFLNRELVLGKWNLGIIMLLMGTPFICGIVYLSIKIHNQDEWYFFLLPGLLILSTFIVMAIALKNFLQLKKDATNFSNQTNSNGTPISIARMYKNLHTSVINLNWFSIACYLYGGLAIIIIHILGGMDEDLDGKWDFIRFSDVKWTYYIICGTMIFFLTNHVIQLILKFKKINEITSIFGSNVLSYGELVIIKKMTRKRDMWISIFVFLLLFFVPLILLKKLFKK